jgi:Tfp pilus assembly protein PilO
MDIRVSSQPVPLTTKTSFSGSVFEIVFLVVVIVVAYFYLVSPKQDEYGTIKNQLSTLKQKQITIENQKTAFDHLVQELDAEPQGVQALDQTLPLDSKPSKLYVLLESLMQSIGLTTGSVTVDADPTVVVAGSKTNAKQPFDMEHKVKPVGITVSATGTIDQLTGLLHSIETSTRLLEVSTLDVSQGRGNQLVFKIGLKAFSYSETASAAPVK